MGPLTRYVTSGAQLKVSKFPLYELKVKAVNCTESLATVGCPCLAAESDGERSRASVVNAASVKARASMVLFLKLRLLNVRHDFPRPGGKTLATKCNAVGTNGLRGGDIDAH